MANRVYDHFAELRRLMAAQHRSCVADKHEIIAARAAIRRSRQLLAEMKARAGLYTKCFAPLPPSVRDSAGSISRL